MNDFIENKIKQKNKAFKLYKNNRMGGNFSNLKNLSHGFSELITIWKGDYNHHLTNGQFHRNRITFRDFF